MTICRCEARYSIPNCNSALVITYVLSTVYCKCGFNAALAEVYIVLISGTDHSVEFVCNIYINSNNLFTDSGEFEGYPTNSNIEYEIKEESDDDKMNISTNGLLKWNQNEISKLRWALNKHKNDFESIENDQKFWELISQELENVGFHRKPEACKNEWDNIHKENFVEKQSDDADCNDIIIGCDSSENLERGKYTNVSKEQGNKTGCSLSLEISTVKFYLNMV